MMKNTLFKLSILFFGWGVFLAACKKDKINAGNGNEPTPTTNRNELTKDSLFLYAKELYLWNDALPTYGAFNPRVNFNQSTNHLTNLNHELFRITRHGINPLTGNFYEYNPADSLETKYSFIEDLVAEGKLAFAKGAKSSVDFNGEGDDFGFSLTLTGNKRNYRVYLSFTSPGSPSALAGLGRGDYINKMNGRSIGSDFDKEEDFINAAINQNSITIGGKRKDGTIFSVTLSKTKYVSSPIFKDTIIEKNTKKIGYLAYARFTDDNNSDLALTHVFNKFANGGVTDLVIDFRYNPGGYVKTAEHLLNLIAPISLNGKTMFVQTYNANLRAGKASILKHQILRDQSGNPVYENGKLANYKDNVSYKPEDNTSTFKKEGSLNNISKVVFITTANTASASELVINSLKPYLIVKTVGETSYGKPVGFFPIRIDKYDVYLSSFYTTNGDGEGNYFAGINPDAASEDEVSLDFGDPAESSFSMAISYLVNGRFNYSADKAVTANGVRTMSVDGVRKSTFNPVFKGMIGEPKIIK